MTAQVIDFAGLARRLLDDVARLVREWLPHGVERNGRWYVGDFDGGEGESANVNLATGQWIDNAAPDEDVGGDLVSLYARIRHCSNRDAALELIERYRWERDYLRDRPGAARQRVAGAQPDPAPAPQVNAVPADPEEPPRQRAEHEPGGRGERWRSVLPVPPYAKDPASFRFAFRDRVQGKWQELDAVKVWPYVFEGERQGYVARFERINSKGERVKDTVPLTWCQDTQDERGGQRWHWKQWAAPRPLYVPAQRIDRDKPVCVVEGEKCAEAGHMVLGDEFTFVAWPGGGKAWAQARWSLLAGLTVFLWADADAQRFRLSPAERQQGVAEDTKPYMPLARQPGWQTMVHIGEELQARQRCTAVFIVQLPEPGVLAPGWDIADAIEAGWDRDRLRAHIRAAVPFRSPNDSARAATGAHTPSMAAAREGEGADPARTWRNYLITSISSGAVQAVRENVVIALDGRPDKGVPGCEGCDGLIRWNEFSSMVEKTRPAPWGSPAGDWLEHDELMMGDWLCLTQGMPSMKRGALEEAVIVVARRHSYHPLRDRLVALRGKWDGEARGETWLKRVLLEEDEHEEALERYLALAGMWFLMGLVARVMPVVRQGTRVVVGPGTKFDYMLVLESPQGWGKSTVARLLVGDDYFADTALDLHNKDSLMNIQGVWGYEWSELAGLARADLELVKQFISSPFDRFRGTFDRRPGRYPRQVVFMGTTNDAHYLMDPTGNRRFWPVRVTRPPDQQWLLDHREQLLAEAVARIDRGERFWPTREEQSELFDPQQRARTIETSLDSAIRTYLYDEHQKVPMGSENGCLVQQVSMRELLNRVGYTIDKQTDAVVKKAAAVLHGLGWTVRRLSHDEEGYRPRVYVRPARRYGTGAAASAAGASDVSTRPTQGDANHGGDDAPPF